MRLHNPERVYFDLPGVEFGPPRDRVFAINDSMLQRVRIGRSPRASLVSCSTWRVRWSTPRPRPAIPTANRRIQFDTTKSAMSRLPSSTTPEAPAAVTPHALTVVIDPGHGGHDTGTIGHNGLQEKQLTLDVARRLGKLLEHDLGAHVLYTRKDDHYISLENRGASGSQGQR